MDDSVELFVKQLPPEPFLYRDVFQPLEKREDGFVCDVLAKSRELGVRWSADFDDRNQAIESFLTGSREVEVFREWINLTFVQTWLQSENPDELPTKFEYQGVVLEWPTLAHALAHYNRAELLRVLGKHVFKYKDIKVFLVYT